MQCNVLVYIYILDEGILWTWIFWHVVPQAFHGVAARSTYFDREINDELD